MTTWSSRPARSRAAIAPNARRAVDQPGDGLGLLGDLVAQGHRAGPPRPEPVAAARRGAGRGTGARRTARRERGERRLEDAVGARRACRAAGYAARSHGVRSATVTIGRPGREQRLDERRLGRVRRGARSCPTTMTAAVRGRRDDAGDLVVGRRDATSRPRRRPASARAARAARPGATEEDVSAGVRSRGRGMTARIRAPGSRRSGSSPSSFADERDRALGDLARERLVGRAADDVEVRHRCRGEPCPEGGEPGDRRRGAPRRRTAGAPRRARAPPRSARSSRRSGTHSSRSSPAWSAAIASIAWASPWGSASMSSASVIVTPRNPSRSRSRSCITSRASVAGRSADAGHRRERDVRGHHEVAPRPRSPPRTAPARGREPCLVEPESGRPRCVSTVGLAQAREVLDRRGDAGGPDAAHHRRGERATERRVVAERADAEVPGWPGSSRGRTTGA